MQMPRGSSRILALVSRFRFVNGVLLVAYEALSDADKRRKYDQCGEECLNQPEGHGGGMNPFGDIFGDFFGGG